MLNFKKRKVLVTHDGSFHTDDVFSCAAFSIFFSKQNQKFKVIRTYDSEIIKTGDIVFDVGMVYDPTNNRFDHHQPGGAGSRDNGIQYAAFGLVWKHYGEKICDSAEIARLIDEKLVQPIDAFDNGLDLTNSTHSAAPYLIQHFFFSLRPGWSEKNRDMYKSFTEAVGFARIILEREIFSARDSVKTEVIIRRAYESAPDRRVIVFDREYPWKDILNKFPEPLFAVYPRPAGNWEAEAVRDNPSSFKNRKNFPAVWGGLRDEELVRVSGVSDAVFCHRGLFMAVAKSKEGAVTLAQKALTSP